jgi:hypothetical protein
MSRTRPQDRVVSPVNRYFEFDGKYYTNDKTGEVDKTKGGTIYYIDKETNERVPVTKFRFMLLDEDRASVGGYDEGTKTRFFSNEFKKKTDKVVVRGKSGDRTVEVATGSWENIKAEFPKLNYVKHLYLMYEEDGAYHIGMLRLKGRGFGTWIDFTKKLRKINEKWVVVADRKYQNNNGSHFYVPVFEHQDADQTDGEKADECDTILQAYFDERASGQPQQEQPKDDLNLVKDEVAGEESNDESYVDDTDEVPF